MYRITQHAGDQINIEIAGQSVFTFCTEFYSLCLGNVIFLGDDLIEKILDIVFINVRG